MSFPRYERYKDSGVEWIGEVPCDWDNWRLSHAFGVIGSGTTPPSNEDQWYEDGSIPWVTTSELRESLITETLKSVTDNALCKFSALRAYPVGSLVIAMYGATIGRLGILGVVATTNQACCVLCHPNHLGIRFCFYWFQGFKEKLIAWYATGGGQPNINQQILAALRIPAPSLDEQTTIAAFLDRETAKIDALIAEQQRLIEMLKEKRQAVISHAVTKGLNPDAPMKDSGIEWLREVPEHWEVTPFKRHLIFLTSGSRGWAEHYSDEGALFIRIGNLTRDSIQIDLSDIQRVTIPEGTEGERTKVQSGDVLFSITAYLGSVAVVPENLEPAYVSQHVALARLNQKHLLPAWAAYVTLSFIGKNYLQTQGYGGTKIQLSLDDVANLVMTLPDTEEQSIITAFLDRETAKLDALTAEAQTAIRLLQERRTALISAAVTGKIDVRGLVSAQPEAEAVA